MGKLHPHTVTLYNAVLRPSDGRLEYHRTILDGVSWTYTRGVKMGETGTTTTRDFVTVYIPFDVKTSGKPYKPPDAHANPNTEWTLRPGDTIIKGSINDDISKIAELAKYSEKVTIESAQTYDMGLIKELNHWEVIGV